MATFLINDVRDAYDDEEGSDNPALVEKNLKKIINIIEPLTDANNLVDEIKEHKVTAMQRVANIIGLAPPEKAMKINELMN